jgi:hypothetical protein
MNYTIMPVMIILKHRGTYLETKMNSGNKNNIVLFILMILGGIGALWGVATKNIIIIVVSAALMRISWVIYKKSRKNEDACRKGITGEQTVIDALRNLNDSFYLINDIILQQPYGNIDHILLGPNGIFVIETKNYKGIIECDGDEWHRRYENRRGPKDFTMTSPSKQVKRNAVGLKNFLSNAVDIMKNKPYLFINSILVFTEPDIDLRLNNSTVPVLEVGGLYDYISSFKNNNLFTNDDLKSIANVIIESSK